MRFLHAPNVVTKRLSTYDKKMIEEIYEVEIEQNVRRILYSSINYGNPLGRSIPTGTFYTDNIAVSPTAGLSNKHHVCLAGGSSVVFTTYTGGPPTKGYIESRVIAYHPPEWGTGTSSTGGHVEMEEAHIQSIFALESKAVNYSLFPVIIPAGGYIQQEYRLSFDVSITSGFYAPCFWFDFAEVVKI